MVEHSLDHDPLEPQEQGAAEEQCRGCGDVRAEEHLLSWPDPLDGKPDEVERRGADERRRGDPLQVHEGGVPDDTRVCVQRMECGDERDESYQERQHDVPEPRQERVPPELHVVSEEPREQDYHAVDEQYAPVWNCLL